MRNNAFTLIELLVVVAIIAMLIAILLPSMSRARETAKAVVCASNQRQIGVSTFLYTASSKGVLPPYVLGTEVDYMANIGRSRWLDDGNRWLNHGLLWTTRHVSDGRIFYCPAQRYEPFTYEIHAKPTWPTRAQWFGTSAFAVRGSFNFNPHVVDNPGNYRRKHQRVDDLWVNDALALDIVEIRPAVPHGNFDAWNILKGDTSVRYVAAPDLAMTMLESLPTFAAMDLYALFEELDRR